MRILTALHSFEPGGVERVALRLVRAWREEGVDAPLFMGREDGALREELADALEYDVPQQPRLGSAWWETLWMIARLPAEIDRLRPDALFCAGSTYSIIAVAMKLRFGRRCPPVLAKISNDLMRRDLPKIAQLGWRAWLRIQARFVDRWVVMEPALVDDLTATLGNVAYSVIRDPAIGAAQLSLSRESAGLAARVGRHFVAIGRLVSQKNIALMLRAFAAGTGQDDRLTIYGDGPLRGGLERLAQALGVETRIVFASHVADAASRLDAADIFLLSSDYEGVPAVLVEALAAGLSIVATDAGPGVRALLQDGALGRIVPPREPNLLAIAIREAKPGSIDPQSARAIAASFTIERGAGLYLDAFEQLLDDPTIAGAHARPMRRGFVRQRIAA